MLWLVCTEESARQSWERVIPVRRPWQRSRQEAMVAGTGAGGRAWRGQRVSRALGVKLAELGDRLALGKELKRTPGFLPYTEGGAAIWRQRMGGGQRLVPGMLDWRHLHSGMRRFRKQLARGSGAQGRLVPTPPPLSCSQPESHAWACWSAPACTARPPKAYLHPYHAGAHSLSQKKEASSLGVKAELHPGCSECVPLPSHHWSSFYLLHLPTSLCVLQAEAMSSPPLHCRCH